MRGKSIVKRENKGLRREIKGTKAKKEKKGQGGKQKVQIVLRGKIKCMMEEITCEE